MVDKRLLLAECAILDIPIYIARITKHHDIQWNLMKQQNEILF